MTTPQPTPALAACPFCGSVKITVEWEPCEPMAATDTNRRWFAECTQCSCQGPFCQRETEIVSAWNRRTPAPGLRIGAEVERVLGGIHYLALNVKSKGREWEASLCDYVASVWTTGPTPQAALDALESRLKQERKDA